MVAGGVVLKECEDRAAAVGDELLTHAGKQSPGRHARVLRAGVLPYVGGREREQVAALLAFEVGAAKLVPGLEQRAAALGGGDVDVFSNLRALCAHWSLLF